MTFSIDDALVTQFSDQVNSIAQQKKFRLQPAVEMMQVKGKDAAIERLDRVESIEVTSRHADTVAQDITHSRRKLAMREFRTTILLDDFDDVSTLIDPQRGYADAIAASMNRRMDRICAQAAFADVLTGRNFGTTVAFASDDGVTIAAGTTGLTYDKLIESRQNFIDNNVGVEADEELFVTATGQQNTNMMGETELTSGDFTREYSVERGVVVNAAGFKVLNFSGTDALPVISKSGANREVIAMAKGAIVLGISKAMTLKINERPDKNNALQLQASMYIGAVRRDGKRIQKINCVEV